jgi:hypothetical protein
MDASRFFSSSPESAAPDATHVIDKTKRIGSKMVRIGSSYVINSKSQSGLRKTASCSAKVTVPLLSLSSGTSK